MRRSSTTVPAPGDGNPRRRRITRVGRYAGTPVLLGMVRAVGLGLSRGAEGVRRGACFGSPGGAAVGLPGCRGGAGCGALEGPWALAGVGAARGGQLAAGVGEQQGIADGRRPAMVDSEPETARAPERGPPSPVGGLTWSYAGERSPGGRPGARAARQLAECLCQ